jgi:hypothetical protein
MPTRARRRSIRGAGREDFATSDHFTRVGFFEEVQAADERALAGSRCAEQREDIAAPCPKVNTVEHLDVIVRLGNPSGCQHRDFTGRRGGRDDHAAHQNRLLSEGSSAPDLRPIVNPLDVGTLIVMLSPCDLY